MARAKKPFKVTIEKDAWYGPRISVWKVLSKKEEKEKKGDEFYDPQYDNDETLLECEVETESSCCGFPVLSQWTHGDLYGVKDFKGVPWEDIGVELGKKLKRNYKYLSTYLPDNKEYANFTKVVEAAGFKKGVALKSKHGRYNNIRWEFFGKGMKDEASVSTRSL